MPYRAQGLVGRESELDAIIRFLDGAPNGPGALLIEGPPGIGKSTLWFAGVEMVRDRGWWALTCRPVESEASMSFAALSDLLEALPEAAFASLPGPQRHALDVALLRAEPASQPPDPRAVAVAVLGVIRALSASAPVLICVDDLPWLDGASASVLEYAVRRLVAEPAGLLATSPRRLAAAGEPAITSVLPDERRETLSVGPLTLEPIAALLDAKGNRQLSWPKVIEVHGASGGNPFLALEFAAALGGSPDRQGRATPLPVPDSLQPLVRRRLDAVSAAARRVSLIVAAAASPTPELVTAVYGDGNLAAEGLLEAEAAGILVATPKGVRFDHPMLRSLCYSSASESERRWVHQRLAACANGAEEQVRHLALASAGPDESLAQRASQAAREALGRGAAVSAAELADLALDLSTDAASDVRVGRLVDAGRLHLAAFDPSGATRLLEAAADLSPRGPQRAAALHQLARACAYTEGVPTARPHLEQALVEAPDGSLLKALIHRDLGYAMGLSSDGFGPATIQHFLAAFDIAEHLGEDELLTELEAFHAVAEFVAGNGVRDRLVQRALARVPLRRLAMEQRPRILISHVYRSSDDLAGARSLLEAELEEAHEQGAESDLPFVVMHLVTLHTWTGDLDAAQADAKEGVSIARAAGAVTQLACMHGAQAAYLAFRGPLDEARNHAEAAVDAGLRSGVYYPVLLGCQALGLVELLTGRPAAAHAVLGAITDAVAGWHLVDPGWIALRAVPDDIEALVRMGDLDGAEALLAPLELRADRLDRISAVAAAGRCRALLMSARGNEDEALLALDRALSAHERVGMPLESARTHLIAAEVHRRARRRQAARQHAEAARSIFSQLGAIPWAHRAHTDLVRLGAERSEGPELTPVQREVASLVAAGRTNREVAAELYMGLRTVEAHLSAVYRKLGIRSRSELAATWAEGSVPHA